MLKFLAKILKWIPDGKSRKHGADPEDEDIQAFESLAMTEELREALFPKTTQMVSAIFDRPAPLDRKIEPAAPAPAASAGKPFPIIF